MNRSLLLMMMLLCAGICAGQGAEHLVVERKPIALPAFDSNRQISRYATHVEYAEASADAAYRYERLLYPAIVFSRGGLAANNQAPVLLTMIWRLAREGFVVFAPMFRGSDGMEGHDELGGADPDDLKNAIEVVKSIPAVDADNVFLYGEARGGMMTYFALRENWPVRAAAVWGAITDMADYLKSKDPDSKLARRKTEFMSAGQRFVGRPGLVSPS